MCHNEYQYISSWQEKEILKIDTCIWDSFRVISSYSPLLCTWCFNLKPWKFLHQQILLFINESFPLFYSNFISLHDIFLFDYIFFSYYIIHLMFLLLVDLWYWLECFRWLNVFLRMYTLIIYFWYTLIFYFIRIEMLFFILYFHSEFIHVVY